MGLLVLSVVLLLTVALGIAVAKGVLNLVLHLVAEQPVPAVDAVPFDASGLTQP